MFWVVLTFLMSLRSLTPSPGRCTSSLSEEIPRSHKSERCWGAAEPSAFPPPPWISAAQLWTVFVPKKNKIDIFLFSSTNTFPADKINISEAVEDDHVFESFLFSPGVSVKLQPEAHVWSQHSFGILEGGTMGVWTIYSMLSRVMHKTVTLLPLTCSSALTR